jgi:inorganic pyrophosphatase
VWADWEIPDGKQENSFAFSGECKNKKYALEVIKECNEAWERLITGKTKPPEGVNTYLPLPLSAFL